MQRSIPLALSAGAFALTVLLSTAACDAAKQATARDTWSRSYAIAPGGRFALVNVNGGIRAEASDGTRVELVGKRTARAATEADARALLEGSLMREDTGADGARVEVIAPGAGSGAELQVSWTIRVPRGVTLDLQTENGRIALSGLSGEVRAATVNGGISGEALGTTQLSAETVNGGVEIELTTPLASGGRVALEAVNGGVSLALPEDSRASVSAEVLNGGIEARGLALEKSGASSRTQLEGTLNGGGARVTLETVNGGARLSRTRANDPERAAETAI